MKLFVATECRLIAKNFNVKDSKEALQTLTADAMYVIHEAAKRGEFQVDFELGGQPERVGITFDVVLRDMGYKVTGANDVRVIQWG